ncbi:unnamed protein product [Linum trigynum]|uniref:Uncharacterized protein n=1 Tax=Linum trigynum TaxID=586398 RepID=A0AAV2GWJ4_9ROSI
MKLVLVVSLLLLPFFLQQAQRIRPEKGFLDHHQQKKKRSSSPPSMEERSSFDDHHSIGNRVAVVVGEDGAVCKEGQECKNTGTDEMKTMSSVTNKSSSSSSSHHWFHEDYYGPKIHRPRHH